MAVNPFNPNASRYQIKTRHPEGLTPSETANLDSRVTELENYLTSQGNIVQITDDYTLLNGTFIDKVYCKPGINLTLPELDASLGKRFQFIQDYSQAPELMQNGDCEEGFPQLDGDTYVASSTVTESLDTTIVHEGSQSLKLVNDGNAGSYIFHQYSLSTFPSGFASDQIYTSSFWIYLGAGVLNTEFSFVMEDGDGSIWYNDDEAPIDFNKLSQWQKVSFTHKIDSSAVGFRIRAKFFDNADPGETVYIDEVSLKKIETTTISAQSPDYITHSELLSITLTSEGDYWEVEGSPVYWDLKAGYESIVGNNEGVKRFDATMEQWGYELIEQNGTKSAFNNVTYEIAFIDSFPYITTDSTRFLEVTSIGSSSNRPTSTDFKLFIQNINDVTQTQSTYCSWHAIGRWY